jgi:hypothetical protein
VATELANGIADVRVGTDGCVHDGANKGTYGTQAIEREAASVEGDWVAVVQHKGP